GKSSRYPSPVVCVTFHDMHHSTYNYNYANHFSFWDRVMGTLHPEYDASVVRMEEKIAGHHRKAVAAVKGEEMQGSNPA
ncbi:sterol desaturase family protein, partial [Acuticoccus mangrovi]|nr:sterol desaturase family protein [Acuticoccus mangrovi]